MTALESYRPADCGIDLVDMATGELLAAAAVEAPPLSRSSKSTPLAGGAR